MIIIDQSLMLFYPHLVRFATKWFFQFSRCPCQECWLATSAMQCTAVKRFVLRMMVSSWWSSEDNPSMPSTREKCRCHWTRPYRRAHRPPGHADERTVVWRGAAAADEPPIFDKHPQMRPSFFIRNHSMSQPSYDNWTRSPTMTKGMMGKERVEVCSFVRSARASEPNHKNSFSSWPTAMLNAAGLWDHVMTNLS